MKDGFIKVSAGTPDVRVADCEYNAGEIICMVHEMAEKGAMVMVFLELCITGYTCKRDSSGRKHSERSKSCASLHCS